MEKGGLRVVWLQAASCTGCTISILNSSSFKVKNLLLDEIVPGHYLCLLFQQTIMAGSGEKVIEVLRQQAIKENFFLVMEGSIPTKDNGIYCRVGEKTMLEWFGELASASSGIISLGTCSSFGGMFASFPNPAGCVGVKEACKLLKIEKPIINVPGCPPHPDWFIGTIVHLLNKGMPVLDDVSRPLDFYGGLIHENCPRRPYFDKGKFAYKFGQEGCLYLLGCRGPFTNSDCPLRQWNGGINWLIKNGAPCFGCVEPDFPEKMVPFFEKLKEEKI